MGDFSLFWDGLKGVFEGDAFEFRASRQFQFQNSGSTEWQLDFEQRGSGLLVERGGRFMLLFPEQGSSIQAPSQEFLEYDGMKWFVTERAEGCEAQSGQAATNYFLSSCGDECLLLKQSADNLLYRGRYVGFDELSLPEVREKVEGQVRGAYISPFDCPGCRAGLHPFSPHSQLLICKNCGAAVRRLASPEGQKPVALGSSFHRPTHPTLSLGSVLTLPAGEFRVVSTREGEQSEDYILYHPLLGYRTLNFEDGHFILFEQIEGIPSVLKNGGSVVWKGRTYSHLFLRSDRLETVSGEFATIALGTHELHQNIYLGYPYVLKSSSDEEGNVSWHRGRYVPWEEAKTLSAKLRGIREPTTISYLQRNPYKQLTTLLWKPLVGGLLISCLLIMSGFLAGSGERLAKRDALPLPLSQETTNELKQTLTLNDIQRGEPLLIKLSSDIEDRWVQGVLTVGGDSRDVRLEHLGAQDHRSQEFIFRPKHVPARVTFKQWSSGPPLPVNIGTAWNKPVVGNLSLEIHSLPQKRAWFALLFYCGLWILPWLYLKFKEKQLELSRSGV